MSEGVIPRLQGSEQVTLYWAPTKQSAQFDSETPHGPAFRWWVVAPGHTRNTFAGARGRSGTALNHQCDANYSQGSRTPPGTVTIQAPEGSSPKARSSIGQTKDDPRIFNWPVFDAAYVPPGVLRLDR